MVEYGMTYEYAKKAVVFEIIVFMLALFIIYLFYQTEVKTWWMYIGVGIAVIIVKLLLALFVYAVYYAIWGKKDEFE